MQKQIWLLSKASNKAPSPTGATDTCEEPRTMQEPKMRVSTNTEGMLRLLLTNIFWSFVFVSDPCSVHERNKAVVNKKDKTWLGVKPFFVKAALFSQMRARRVILTETRQWKRATEVNPITMDSKTGECYSTPQKLLPHPNEVYLPIEKPCLHYKAGKRSMQFKFGYCHIQSQKGLEVRINFFAISFELDVDVCADSAAVSSWEPMYHLLLIVYLTVCYHYD